MFIANYLINILIFYISSAVTVNFGRSLYSYSENHGVVSDITITLSTTIAQSLTVTVSGGNDKYIITVFYLVTLGPGTQLSTIEISGVDVNEMITLVARGSQSQGLPNFTIINDTVALETTEQYNLSFHNSSITNGVILGFDTIIRIIDDDGKNLFLIFNLQVKYFSIHLLIILP